MFFRVKVQLYEDFAKSRAKQSVEDTITEGEPANTHGTSHVFQVNSLKKFK